MTYFSWPWSGKRLLTHSTRAAEAGRLEPLEDRVLLSTYLVTSAADDGSTGTLRWAIGQVNGGPGGDLIDFQIGVFASAQTITLSSSLGPLPAVSKAATIDGLSQGAGQNGKLTVEINGSAVTGDGLTVTAGGVTLDGLAIANFSGNGVVLNNPAGSAGDTVIGDFVGTDYTGTAAAGNGGDGVLVLGGNNTVGGPVPPPSGPSGRGMGPFAAIRYPPTVLSGNAGNGVNLSGARASNDVVANSYIGVDRTGVTKLANGGSGVLAQGGANNTIGGASAGNVVSGNGQYGIYFNNSSKNQVLDNIIGLGSDGSTIIKNTLDGVAVVNGSANNTIGGGGAGNVISGNGGNGIRISTANATGNTILGNLIGTAGDGSTGKGNVSDGVLFNNFTEGNTVGGINSGELNVISDNGQNGVEISGGANKNLVAANLIGTDQTGALPLGNGSNGVALSSGNNTVGVAASGAHNIISANPVDGIDITSDDNLVVNSYIGTDISGGSPMPNATGIFLHLTASNNNIIQNVISGNSQDGILLFTGAASDFINSNEIGTNAFGTAGLPNGRNGVLTSGTPRNIVLDHNLISGNLGDGVSLAAPGTVLTDNYIGVDGSGTFAIGNRGAAGIELVDSSATAVTIGGNAANLGNVISGNLGAGVLIQPGSNKNVVAANFIGTDVNGTSAIPNYNGVVVYGDHNTIGGTVAGAMNVIAGNRRAGVDLYGSVATNNLVSGNNIGVGAQGNEATVGNGVWGIISELRASNNTFGGQTSATRNVISNNGLQGSKTTNGQGCGIYLTRSTGNVIEGNYIGVGRDGSTALGNAADGFYVEASANSNTIGGTVANAGNVISGNGGGGFLSTSGVEIFGALNVVAANYIGTDATGLTAVGNFGDGVLVNGANNTIGGTVAAEGNVIAANGTGPKGGYGLDILAGATGTSYDYDFIGYNLALALLPNKTKGVNNLGAGTIQGTHNDIQP